MGLVDAPDPQEAERGLEHCRMVQFLISLSQMVHYKYDQLLEVVELKYLNVCALGTPLIDSLMSVGYKWPHKFDRCERNFIAIQKQ